MEKGPSSTPLLGNRYQLLQTLGTGGTAVVYKAKDLMLERLVAIKVLRQDFSNDNAFRERFHQEAKAAANLSHPNIVTVHDFGLDSGRLYIVMEYVSGTDLKSSLKQSSPFSVSDAINIMVQACAGIGYAHRAGIVHCDVKPHNMLVSSDNRLKVTDFGIARALASIHPDEKSDIVWGSPQYFSPEQASGAAPSPASDVYSLGVVLYELLTGRLPLTSNDPTELARLHRDVMPVPPRSFAPEIPPALEQIVMKVLSKEPAARYRTADQLGRVLTTFAQESAHSIANNKPVNSFSSVSIPNSSVSSQVAAEFEEQEEDNTLNFDWFTIALGLLSVISVGGLIPFWMYIILYLNANFR
jgi:eukaryotic-like serine/threonine-protein kinase